MQAEFRFHHPHECKRYPERFLSNSLLHRHIDTHHTEKSTETSPPASPTRYPAPPSPPNTPKSAPSHPPSPILAPTTPEKPLPAAQTSENAPPTPPQIPTPSPDRDLPKSQHISPTKTVEQHEKSPFVYLPPQKRAYMTIAQLFTKLGSRWLVQQNNPCSKFHQPIRKLDPTAPVWTHQTHRKWTNQRPPKQTGQAPTHPTPHRTPPSPPSPPVPPPYLPNHLVSILSCILIGQQARCPAAGRQLRHGHCERAWRNKWLSRHCCVHCRRYWDN